MSTPDLENVLSEYARNIAQQQGADAKNWAALTHGGARFVELFRNGKFREASDLLEELEDIEYKLTLNCEATSLLGNGCGGYSVEDHGWVFGEEAAQAREEERQDDGDLPRTRSWTDVPMRRPVSLWLGALQTDLHGIVLRKSLRNLLILGRQGGADNGIAIEYVIKSHDVAVWCSAVARCPAAFHLNPLAGRDTNNGISSETPFSSAKQFAFAIAMLGYNRPPLQLRVRSPTVARISRDQVASMIVRFGGLVNHPDDDWKWDTE